MTEGRKDERKGVTKEGRTKERKWGRKRGWNKEEQEKEGKEEGG